MNKPKPTPPITIRRDPDHGLDSVVATAAHVHLEALGDGVWSLVVSADGKEWRASIVGKVVEQ